MVPQEQGHTGARVSMKSGLEGRNNPANLPYRLFKCNVSMKSGLEGRNNAKGKYRISAGWGGLNEVRPRRPEQFQGMDLWENPLKGLSQ